MVKKPNTTIWKLSPKRMICCPKAVAFWFLALARIAPPKACIRKQRTSPPIEYFGETRESNLAEGSTTGCSDDAAKGQIDGYSKEDRSEQYGWGLHDLYAHDCGRGYSEYARPNSENSTAKGYVSTDGSIRWPVFLRRIQNWIITGYTFIRRRSQKESRTLCDSWRVWKHRLKQNTENEYGDNSDRR
jgi:hypothetical protein